MALTAPSLASRAMESVTHQPEIRQRRRLIGQPIPHAASRPSLRLLVAGAAFAIVVGMAVSVANIVADQLRQTAKEAALQNVETIVRGFVDPTIDPATLELGGVADEAITAELI